MTPLFKIGFIEVQKTLLYTNHERQNANMVDFCGWLMPLHYGSQLEEHYAVRTSVGVFDVSHMTVVDCHGSQVQEFLRFLLANDIAKLKNNQAMYSCMLNQQGGVIDDLIAYKISENAFRLVVNSATREKNIAWFNQHAENFDVIIAELSQKIILAIQGPKAIEKISDSSLDLLPAGLASKIKLLKPFSFCQHQDQFQSAANTDQAWFVARTGYTGESGVEIILPEKVGVELWQKLMTANIQACGLGARDTLRLEAGLNLYGNDMSESTSPLVSNLAWTVDFGDLESRIKYRKFIGRVALEREKSAGVSQQLVGIILEDKGVLRAGQEIQCRENAKSIGVITSGGFSPSLKQGIGLVRVNNPIESECVCVEMRGKLKAARLVRPVFVRNGEIAVKSLINHVEKLT